MLRAPARLIPTDDFFNILGAFLAHSEPPDSNGKLERKEQEGGIQYNEAFFAANASFIEDSISTASKSIEKGPFEVQPRSLNTPLHDSSILDASMAGCEVQSSLLSLLQNIRLAEEYSAKGRLSAAVMELARAVLAYRRYYGYDPSCHIVLDPFVTESSRVMTYQVSHVTIQNRQLTPGLSSGEELAALEILADKFYQDKFLDSAEILIDQLILEHEDDDEGEDGATGIWRHQSVLFNVLF